MKAFRFKLETLLSVKKREEEQAQMLVLQAEQEVRLLEKELHSLKQEMESTEQQFRREQQGLFSATLLHDLQTYLYSLQGKIAAQEDKIFRANNILHQKRQKLSLAMKERKSIEKLKEKQYGDWQKEIARQEAEFLDELGTIRHKDKG